ncbi:MAG: glycosyl transferase family 1 [Pseudomonas sp.]|uniref:glycosyltransferase family 4 protein n=1 Tax=Pseudomonas sp. TaxID=306 RepID=UPI000CC15217|nr:glycosyltransferase family 4 protein [Pseudomonas sp.]PJI48441.1 MAG: glycosyl transferase family 1 [Pseudomonas sp.]
MKVLHFFKVYLPESVGGVEQVIYQLCESSARFDVKGEVLALSNRPSEQPLMVGSHRVHQVPRNFSLASTGVSWQAIGKLRELAEQADVIHYHFPWPFMDIAHFLADIRKPNVVTYHSDIIRQKNLLRFYRPLMRRFLQQSNRIIVTSPNYFATSSILGDFREKVSVIPIGLDRDSYPSAKEETLQRWTDRLGDERFFLFIGVMRYYKGLHILLEALQGTSLKVVIVGAGPLERELRRQAEALRVESNLEFLGRVDEDDKIALLELSYGVVFPSHLRSEAFGISLLEGAMFGKPLISSEIGTGTSYINIHGETGLVVPPNDPAAFRAAMQRLWDDTALAAQMGSKAIERFRQLFTAESMARRHADLYREVLAECAWGENKQLAVENAERLI